MQGVSSIQLILAELFLRTARAGRITIFIPRGLIISTELFVSQNLSVRNDRRSEPREAGNLISRKIPPRTWNFGKWDLTSTDARITADRFRPADRINHRAAGGGILRGRTDKGRRRARHTRKGESLGP